MRCLYTVSIFSSFLLMYGTMISAQVEGVPESTWIATGTIRGQIVDTGPRQNPIPNVRVVIVSTAGTEDETTTDGNGEFEKSGVSPGRYLVSVYRIGYRNRVGEPVTVISGGDHFLALKMTKKDIASFFGDIHPTAFLLQLIFILFFLVLVAAILKIFAMSRDIKEIKDLLEETIDRRNRK